MAESQTTTETKTICANCGNNLYQVPDPNNIHWYHAGTLDVRCPTRFAKPVSASVAPSSVLKDLFALFTKDSAAHWNFNSLSRDADKLDEVMERLSTVASVAPASNDRLIEAFRDAAIKCHIGFKHEGKWEECEWVECEDRRKMIQWVTAPASTVAQEHRCPHFQPKGEDSDGAYNAQIIIDVENDLLDTYSKERINAKPRSWYSLLIKNLIQRIANLRVMLAAASTSPAAPTPSEPWSDEGGHVWERRPDIECVECPHCLFIFAAIHTSGEGYSCPNCEGCPDVSRSDTTESPILAFESWLLRWVADHGRKLNQDEYGIAYAAFIAAHPGEGPKSHVMAASPAAPSRQYFCSCGATCTAEEYIEHYFEKGHDRGDVTAISPLGYEHAITIGWDKHNARRHELIEAKRSRPLSESETAELFELQWLAGIKRELGSGPLPAALQDEAELVDEVQRRMDHVVETAVEWHKSDDHGWAEAADKHAAAIESLLDLRGDPTSAMPRRWCSVHNREEFKYESLEHELKARRAGECFCGVDLEAGLCPNGHDPITPPTEPSLTEFQEAYNQGVEDAQCAIRAESQGGGYWAATYINAIARRCSPFRYTGMPSDADEATREQIVQAITDIQEARESHLQWAAHLRLPHTFECQGCTDHTAHIGDAKYHDEWIAKYDNVIAALAHVPFATTPPSTRAQAAAQEIVSIAYQDRGQVPHADTITAIILKRCFAEGGDTK